MRRSVKEHVALLQRCAGGMRIHTAFETAVTLIFHALAKVPNPDADHEARYMAQVKRLKDAGAEAICQEYSPRLLTELVSGQANRDLLGQIASHVGTLEKSWGQCFTPYDVCQLMADVMIDPEIARRAVTTCGYVSVLEPASGSGAMILAVLELLEAAGIELARIYVDATDFDPFAHKMCFVQLATRRVPARVILGNSLTLEAREISVTRQMYGLVPLINRPPEATAA